MTTPTHDIYPSRLSGKPQIIERQDPTVWGSFDAPGPLSREQLEAFDRDGYIYLPGVFSAEEVAAYRAELSRLTLDPKIRAMDQTVLEAKDDTVRSIFEIHKSSELFKGMAKDPRVADVARQILGSDVYIHQSRVNLKQAMFGKGFFWHSDFETWHAEDGMPRMRALSASIALTENNEFNGPLMVVPGSHRSFISCVGPTPDENYKVSLVMQEAGTPDLESLKTVVDKGGIVAPKGPAGGIVFFDCNIMHASTENLSPFPRSNGFFVYNSVENTLEKPFSAEKPRPEFAGSHDYTPVGQL